MRVSTKRHLSPDNKVHTHETASAIAHQHGKYANFRLSPESSASQLRLLIKNFHDGMSDLLRMAVAGFCIILTGLPKMVFNENSHYDFL